MKTNFFKDKFENKVPKEKKKQIKFRRIFWNEFMSL